MTDEFTMGTGTEDLRSTLVIFWLNFCGHCDVWTEEVAFRVIGVSTTEGNRFWSNETKNQVWLIRDPCQWAKSSGQYFIKIITQNI